MVSTDKIYFGNEHEYIIELKRKAKALGLYLSASVEEVLARLSYRQRMGHHFKLLTLSDREYYIFVDDGTESNNKIVYYSDHLSKIEDFLKGYDCGRKQTLRENKTI